MMVGLPGAVPTNSNEFPYALAPAPAIPIRARTPSRSEGCRRIQQDRRAAWTIRISPLPLTDCCKRYAKSSVVEKERLCLAALGQHRNLLHSVGMHCPKR